LFRVWQSSTSDIPYQNQGCQLTHTEQVITQVTLTPIVSSFHLLTCQLPIIIHLNTFSSKDAFFKKKMTELGLLAC